VSRITTAINARLNAGKKVFVGYLTAGDPSLDATADYCAALAEGGVDIIELGIPYTDPVADGPTNQRAAERALRSGTTLGKVLQKLPAIRARVPETPLLIFTYLNPVYAMGYEVFAERARAGGADGALIVDLPPEEATSFCEIMKNAGLDTVFLASPTSDTERLGIISGHSTGFVYYVSRTGVTGEKHELSQTLQHELDHLRSVITKPVMVGFGISEGAQAAQIADWADGVVVGSAIVKLVEQHGAGGAAVVREFAASIRRAIDE
jgi:tryptophan synthase alpha chain